ncbi:hypothetical protein [Rubinisphaera margarita]|uniref:hypothetical protein n=1 Tax=Rubinisphaera margarita TaxID=2909586 RepID=UPI001EE8F054|nr:hypothetical protein [Rubinisphaera margarita]MCG6157200.1 hypothetical protein [Rubinisphaera margarita]
MESLFTWCAVIGGTIFTVQFIMLLIGLDGGGELDFDTPDLDVPDADFPDADLDGDVSLRDAEVDFDHHPDALTDGWFVGIVSFRSIIAAVTVFGLTGLGALQHMPQEKAFATACLAALAMLYLVGWSFKQIYKLRSDGTVKINEAVGEMGTVYLTIPGEDTGAGKVQITLGGRTMEYRATTDGPALKTGTPIVVTRVTGEDSVEVRSQQSTSAAADPASAAV